MDRKRILLVLTSLEGGGAQRVAVTLLEYLNRERFEPSVVLVEDIYDCAIPKDIPIVCLHKKSRYDLFKIIRKLAKVFEREEPDIVLSFTTYPNLIAILARKFSHIKPKLLLSEHIHVSSSLKHERPWGGIKGHLIRFLYPRADRVICVSSGTARDLVAHFKVPPEKVKVIYNPVDIKHILKLATEPVEHSWFTKKETPIIITMGRLTPQKGHSYLLKAFARVVAKHPCRLVILGQGEERQALETLTRELGIEKEVAFLGFQTNPFKYLARADLFVLSSLWEGFSLVIVEAMVCGIPIVSTHCPSGPDEIITDGENGLLVPVADEEAMAEAILQLLNDKDFATKLAQAGRKWAEDFAVAKITKEYDQLLSTIATSL